MTIPAPDPAAVRAASVAELRRLRLPLPPPHFPMVWEPGDEVELRPTAELEGRTAILNVVLARCFGMPPQLAMGWLLNAHLMDAVTPPEWHFVMSGRGDHRSFVLHLEAVYALTWLLGITKQLDPVEPSDDRLMALLPHLAEGETFAQWRSRTLVAPVAPDEAAALLDLYYCLDWGYLEAERLGLPLPGRIDANAIGQRRWALEWAVVFRGPFHDPPGGWEDVDLSA
ncbi:MAG TPA: DUF4272 domain-containing protein [Pilimelia sp.]|nr:DUF4272 domain-containing protein [Pilimelia sp.]